MRSLITGSNGLIGSEAVLWLDAQGHTVAGIDNNMRADFFGPKGDTRWMLDRLKRSAQRFTHFDADIRDRAAMLALWRSERPELIIHCAAQPSHDLAATRPLDDFDVNAVGTINLLEEPPPSGFLGDDAGEGGGSAEFLVNEPEHAVVRVSAPVRGFLHLADQYFPGWSATVDGRPAPILRANFLFRAVEVPAGESTVEFHYAPATVRAGAAISAATLLLLVVVLVVRRRRAVPVPRHLT